MHDGNVTSLEKTDEDRCAARSAPVGCKSSAAPSNAADSGGCAGRASGVTRLRSAPDHQRLSASAGL